MRIPPVLFILVLFSSFFIGGGPLFAEGKVTPKQLAFSLKMNDNYVSYNYVWSDSNGERNLTAFSLTKPEVKLGLGEFRSVGDGWEPGIRSLFLSKVQPMLDRLGMDIEVRGSGSSFSYVLKGPTSSFQNADDLKASIPRLYQLSREEYAKQNFYVGKEEGNRFLLRPDYERVAGRYVEVSKPLAQALGQGRTNPRDVASRFLEFIQSIPYSRQFTNKAEFQTPVGCYTENRGDCDTKSVCMAALLSVYKISWVIVAFPEHVVLGVGVTPLPGDEVIRDGGCNYVLVEPSGAGYSFGKLASSSLQMLRRGDYFVVR